MTAIPDEQAKASAYLRHRAAKPQPSRDACAKNKRLAPTSVVPIADHPPSRLRVVTLRDVEPEEIRWLWPGYIPFGKVTVLEGDPGLGKSTLAIDIAAGVSRGLDGARPEWYPFPAADVFLVTYEDGVADTIRPRAEAAGAALSRIHVIRGVQRDDGSEDDLFVFPDDVPDLAVEVRKRAAGLVVVDPLSASLSAAIDSHRDQDVRRALAPIARFAEDTGAAVLVVRHLTKSGGRRAIVSGGGSIGIAGAARSVLSVGVSEEDPDRRVLAVVKCNVAKKAPSLVYSLESGTGSADSTVSAPVVRWHGTTDVTADDLAAARGDGVDFDGQGKLGEAKDLLREWLADGPVAKADLVRLGKKQGIGDSTLDRAARAIGVVRQREGQRLEHHSMWALPHGKAFTHVRDGDVSDVRGADVSGAATATHDAASGSDTADTPDSATRVNPPYTRDPDASGLLVGASVVTPAPIKHEHVRIE